MSTSTTSRGTTQSIQRGIHQLAGPSSSMITLVTDPFHVTKLANTKPDESRRRVQNETLGHRGRKSDPPYRCRRLATKAEERLDAKGSERLTGLFRAGDPNGTWPPSQMSSTSRAQIRARLEKFSKMPNRASDHARIADAGQVSKRGPVIPAP